MIYLFNSLTTIIYQYLHSAGYHLNSITCTSKFKSNSGIPLIAHILQAFQTFEEQHSLSDGKKSIRNSFQTVFLTSPIIYCRDSAQTPVFYSVWLSVSVQQLCSLTGLRLQQRAVPACQPSTHVLTSPHLGALWQVACDNIFSPLPKENRRKFTTFSQPHSTLNILNLKLLSQYFLPQLLFCCLLYCD